MKAVSKAQKADYSSAARAVYAAALSAARRRQFYQEMAVPDSFDGRFEVLVLHVFLIIHRMIPEGTDGQALNQALFDVMFADMDQTLREMGIGDMGVPKHMRKMMKAFNGRMHAYQSGMNEDALRRNVYGTLNNPPAAGLQALQDYVAQAMRLLEQTQTDEILAGRISFPEASNQR